MKRKTNQALPLVYACSGCSNVAQMANDIAIALDRLGKAEMSCIAGVGGDVPQLLKTARAGRRIVALDGCPLKCADRCLKRHNLTPNRHYVLTDYGVKKRRHCDFEQRAAIDILSAVIDDIKRMESV